MAETVAVQFVRLSAPYEAGDIAGFPVLRARDLIGRGVATPWPPTTTAPVVAPEALDQFTGMDRPALIAFARDHFGMVDEPPADVTDDALRDILRHQAPAADPVAVADTAAPVAADGSAAAAVSPARVGKAAKSS